MTIEIIAIVTTIFSVLAFIHILVYRSKNNLFHWINDRIYKEPGGADKIMDSVVKEVLEKSYWSMSKRTMLVSILITPAIIFFFLNDISITHKFLKYISLVLLVLYIVLMGFLTKKELNAISSSFINTKKGE